ncbi:GmrSD restriction endonuclease domain-containing protein [Pseudomonas sp. S2_D10]
MGVLDDVSTHRNELKTDSYTTTISDLLATFKRGDLRIDPEYQRLFRWDLNRQSEYIESLLLNIPTPPVFFATNPDGRTEVIDGLQRLSTLLKFFSSEIFDDSELATAENNEAEQNNIKIGTLLRSAPLVESLEGFSLGTLPETLSRTLRYTRIPIIVLEKESSQRARFHVFKRLNRSGSILSDQEIRNCSARLFGHEFPNILKTLAAEKCVKNSLKIPDEQFKKMGVEELILRLLANAHSPKPLKHSVIEFLDEFMEFASEGKFDFDRAAQGKVIEVFDIIYSIYSDGEAFRFWRDGKPQGSFSANLFDIISFGVYKNLQEARKDPEWLKQRIADLSQSKDIREVTGAGTNTRKKHQARLDLGSMWFDKNASEAETDV